MEGSEASDYLRKLTEILEGCLNTKRQFHPKQGVACDLCGTIVHRHFRIGGRTIGLECTCPETLFILLYTCSPKRVANVARKLGISLRVETMPVKEIVLADNRPNSV
jgi:hypothetical protein